MWVSISIDWPIKLMTFNINLLKDIELSNGFLISIFIDWLPQVEQNLGATGNLLLSLGNLNNIVIKKASKSWALKISYIYKNLYIVFDQKLVFVWGGGWRSGPIFSYSTIFLHPCLFVSAYEHAGGTWKSVHFLNDES